MVENFSVRYIPGGMSLSHSGWWLVHTLQFRDGTIYEMPIRMVRKADYK